MALTKTKLSQADVSIDIDLEKLLGSASKNEVVRETFFQLAYDSLLARLEQGIGANGKPLKSYSESYKDSTTFNIFGKDSTVNMQLTGDMVNDIYIKKQTDKIMTVSFQSDENNAKAYAHITGFKDHPTLEGKVKPRDFFGWSDK